MGIKLLSDDLINKIAAGEVIERPASIVKELIDNSIDAGSTRINISILNGGKDYIEVEDNGMGISKEEIPLAFMRHATSKISNELDLNKISTMGFRGEALPSIASVSNITIFTNKTDYLGVKAELEGGLLKKVEDFPCPKGTRIIVKNLFYNTPARKNFLKTTVTEGNAVYDVVCKYALARPDISISFKKDNKHYFKTPGNGSLLDTVITLFGKDYAASLIDINYVGEKYKINGLISTPDFTKGNRKHQHFMVNYRPIRSSILYKAVDTGYKGLLVSKENPVIILIVNLPPSDVDVNVHPQKTEVRFKDEKAIFNTVCEVIKNRLVKIDYNPVQKWNYHTNEDDFSSIVGKPSISQPKAYTNYLNFTETNKTELRDYIMEEPTNSFPIKTLPDIESENKDYKIIGQYNNSYILIEYKDSLWIVDQHAADERIIYSKLKQQYLNNQESSQLLAIPISLDLATEDIEIILQNINMFEQLGFVIELLSPNSIVIRTAPAISLGNEKELVMNIVDMLKEGKNIDIHDETLITMSCKKAIKAGDRLNFFEMETIIKTLLQTEDYKHCPHGRPTLIKLTNSDIERMFKR